MPEEYRYNLISALRTKSQFETFKPRHGSQRTALRDLQRLSEQVVGAAPHIRDNEYPFSVGNIIVLRGQTGTGKTHLAEAFVHRVVKRAPALAKRIVVSNGKKQFATDYCTAEHPFGSASIVVIDDILGGHNANYDNYPGLVGYFAKFITDVYERRLLAIITTKIPVFTQGGIMDWMPKQDLNGTIRSSLTELVVNDYEIRGSEDRGMVERRQRQAGRRQSGPLNKTVLPTREELFPPPPPKRSSKEQMSDEMRWEEMSLHRRYR